MTAVPDNAGAVAFLTLTGLLRDLYLRKATGRLVAQQGATLKKVFFKNGFVLYATSSLPADRLGDVLLDRGMITREQYEESASQVIATGRKQGTVLVQIGALTPKDLFRGLIAQVREIVVSLCRWDEGSWRFFEGLPPQEEIVSLRVNPAGLIFEGLLSIAADPRWGGVWEPLQLELLPAAAPRATIDQIDAPDAARQLYALVEQRRPVAQMARLTGRDAGDLAALLYALVLLGLVDAQPRPAAQPVAAAAAVAAPAPGAAPGAAPAPAAAPAAAAAEPPGVDPAELQAQRQKIAKLAGSLRGTTHYQLLGVAPEADADTIKRSYIVLAKEFHPDRYFRPEYEDLMDAVNTIFMRISEAYSTLHNPTARAEYDREILRLKAPAARVATAPPEDSRLAKEQFAKGLERLNAGDLWAAVQAMRWAVNLAPQNPRYHTWLGVALMRTKKRLHEAEEHCKTAIALDYNNPLYYVHLGQVYRTGHLFDKAKKQFETALRLDPKHPGALKELREMEPDAADKGLLDRFLKK